MPIANYQLHMPPYRRLGVQARRSLFLLRHPPLQPLYSFPAPKPSSPKTSPFSFCYCCLLQVGALESFTRLERLTMTGCIGMTSLALNLPFLRALSLHACSALTQVEPSQTASLTGCSRWLVLYLLFWVARVQWLGEWPCDHLTCAHSVLISSPLSCTRAHSASSWAAGCKQCGCYAPAYELYSLQRAAP